MWVGGLGGGRWIDGGLSAFYADAERYALGMPWCTLCKSVYARVCVCMHIHIRMYVCMYVCVYVCMYACMYVCMHACIYVYMYICIYVCIRPSSDLVQALLLRLCPAIHAPQLKEALCLCIVLLSFVLVSVVFYLAVSISKYCSVSISKYCSVSPLSWCLLCFILQ